MSVGPLEFEVCLRVAVASKKRPKVETIKEAAARTAEVSGSASQLDDVEQWVKEEDEPAKATTETRNFKLNETDEIDLKTTETLPGQSSTTTPHSKPPIKGQPGKLPCVPGSAATDSRQAASDVLNKFFKRR